MDGVIILEHSKKAHLFGENFEDIKFEGERTMYKLKTETKQKGRQHVYEWTNTRSRHH